MNTVAKLMSLSILCWGANAAIGQQSSPPVSPPDPAPAAKPAKGTAQSEAGEPRANTAQSEAGEPRANTAQSEAGEPRAATAQSEAPGPRAVASRPAAGRAAASGQKPPVNADRLELGTATVTGDREQPKVMYIVPWKKSDIGDLDGKPMNSLVDEIMAPVDRDVFKREVLYYKVVRADAPQNGAPSHP